MLTEVPSGTSVAADPDGDHEERMADLIAKWAKVEDRARRLVGSCVVNKIVSGDIPMPTTSQFDRLINTCKVEIVEIAKRVRRASRDTTRKLSK